MVAPHGEYLVLGGDVVTLVHPRVDAGVVVVAGLQRNVFGQQIRTGGQNLAELDEDGAEFFQGFPESLCPRFAWPVEPTPWQQA